MKKHIIFFLILIAFLVLGFLTWHAMQNGKVEVKMPLKITNMQPIIPGDKINFQMELNIPWGDSVKEANLNLPPEFLAYDKVVINYNIWRFGYRKCQINFAIIPLQVGDFKNVGTLNLAYKLKKDLTKNLNSFNLPEIKVIKAKDSYSNSLPIAGKLDKIEQNEATFHWIIGLIILIIICVILWFILKKKKTDDTIKLTAWEQATLELDELQKEGNLGRSPLNICFGLVNDVIRTYIEKRFNWHATALTTPEFLDDLRKNSNELNPKLSDSLANFMQISDIVKFGKGEVDKNLFDNSIDGAKNLIAETTPTEESENV